MHRPAANIGERVLLTLWVGGLWTVGYMVAPALFATLEDRALAGTLAGLMFEIIAWIGMGCAAVLLIINQLRYPQRRLNWRMLVLLTMLVLVMLGAAAWHLQRGEGQNIVLNLVIAAIMGFIAYGRWRMKPLADRAVMA